MAVAAAVAVAVAVAVAATVPVQLVAQGSTVVAAAASPAVAFAAAAAPKPRVFREQRASIQTNSMVHCLVHSASGPLLVFRVVDKRYAEPPCRRDHAAVTAGGGANFLNRSRHAAVIMPP